MTAKPFPVFEHMAELSYHAEQVDDAWADWKRGDVDVTTVTSELYALARAAFATARRLREDDATVSTEGDLFAEPAFHEAHGAHVADPFDATLEIADLPTTEADT